MFIKGKISQYTFVIIFFSIVGFLLYYPILHNTFLSDDYDSLFRIRIEKKIIYKEILRPMIDISFYFNYLMSGFSPVSYYIFNLIVHLATSLLVFILCKSLVISKNDNQFLFAFTAAFLFLIYPFHNESVVWLSGRLSSMACFFALLSLILARGSNKPSVILLSIFMYVIGLLCYESIIVFPLIVYLFTQDKFVTTKKRILYSLYWVIPSLLYLLLRFLLSGSITSSYGHSLTDNFFSKKVLNIPKVFGRLFFPPFENGTILVLGIIVVSALLLVIDRLYIKKAQSNFEKYTYLSLLISLAATLILPFAFGISTRTTEGDRLLYFPSAFLCIIIACYIVRLSKSPVQRLAIFFFIISYCIFFIERNNRQWIKASSAASLIINTAKSNPQNNKLFINVPDEIEGAFVFRNGLKEALILNNIDTANVKALNCLNRLAYLKVSGIINPVKDDNSIQIFPEIRLTTFGADSINITNEKSGEKITLRKEHSLIYYWNKEALIQLF